MQGNSIPKFFNKKHNLIYCCLAWLAFGMHAKASVDSFFVYSTAMKKQVPVSVMLPDQSKLNQHYPIVYYLHGYAGNHANYIQKIKHLQQWVNQQKLVLIFPDAGFSSWYFNSPIDSNMAYEHFIIKDLLPYINKQYQTMVDTNKVGISGLSMGGFGALYLAFTYPNYFKACAAMSGAFYLEAIQNRYDLDKRLGDFITHQNWYRQRSIHTLYDTTKKYPFIYFDCGTEDFIYAMSLQLHTYFTKLKVPHTYMEMPGKHNWEYWNEAMHHQLIYFNQKLYASQ